VIVSSSQCVCVGVLVCLSQCLCMTLCVCVWCVSYDTSWNVESFLSSDTLVISGSLLLSSLSLNRSLRNSTAMKVRADAGMYHAILGMLPLNIPLKPSVAHILWTASDQPLYLEAHRIWRYEKTLNDDHHSCWCYIRQTRGFSRHNFIFAKHCIVDSSQLKMLISDCHANELSTWSFRIQKG